MTAESTSRMLAHVANLHDDALGTMAEVIRLAAVDGVEIALEWLADWMNNHDAVQPGDEKDYAAWLVRSAMEKAVVGKLHEQLAVVRRYAESLSLIGDGSYGDELLAVLDGRAKFNKAGFVVSVEAYQR